MASRERVIKPPDDRPPPAPPEPRASCAFDLDLTHCVYRCRGAPRLHAAFLCPLHANIYGIEFLSFVITDFDSKKTIFEVGRPLADGKRARRTGEERDGETEREIA